MTKAINYFLIGLTLCFCQFTSLAQQSKIDSLLTVLQTLNQTSPLRGRVGLDTNKVNTLNALAMEFRSNNPDTAVYFARQALQLSEKIPSPFPLSKEAGRMSERSRGWAKGIAQAELCWGTAIISLGKYEEALSHMNKALALFNSFPSVDGADRAGAARAYNGIGAIYTSQGNYPDALKNHFSALKIREEIGDKKGIAVSYNNIGNIYERQGNYPDALKNHFAALKIREKIGDKNGIAVSYGNIGIIYKKQGNYPDALKNYFDGLNIMEEIGDKSGIAYSYNNIGNIYDVQGNYSDALKNHFAALKIREGIGDKSGIAASYNNIGNIYKKQGNYPDALKNHFAALKIREGIGDKSGIAASYNNIGDIYERQGNYPDALKNYFAALKIREKIGDKSGIPSSYINIGSVQLKLGNTEEAKKYLENALILSKKIGSKESIKDSYTDLAKTDSAMGKAATGRGLWQEGARHFSNAYEHYKMYIIYRDSLLNEENTKKTVQQQMQYTFDKKEAIAKANQENKDAIQKEEVRRERIIRYSVTGGLGLMFIVALVIFRSLKVTRRQKQIIEIKSKETELQKKIIEEKNKDITGSINYAQRIQKAMLPHLKDIWAAFPQSFVLFKPKDIVSGDFYFFHKATAPPPPKRGINEDFGYETSNNEVIENPDGVINKVLNELQFRAIQPPPSGGRGALFFIAVADCTGHGVPGAFMSMIGSERLNDAVSQSADTSEILSLLNKGVKTALKQSEEDEGSTRDGMDIALVRLDLTGFENLSGLAILDYAGANRPLWLIRKGQTSVEEIKATKKAIGGFTEDGQHFDTHEIKLQKGDTFYISTDGYADQFSGQSGKKIMTKKFKEILLEIQDKTMQEQKKYLDNFVENWKAGTEQVDDILVIGVRL